MAEEFILHPPVGWLNRVDDLLVHHQVTDHHGSPLGTALGNLIRSWAGPESGYGPDHWGPRGRIKLGTDGRYRLTELGREQFGAHPASDPGGAS